MFFLIPGEIIAVATFPGIVVHEAAHVLFCKLTRTPIQHVCYFRYGSPAGYVIHDWPTSVWKQILIGIGPLILNTLIGFALGVTAALTHLDFDHIGIVSGLFLWLAVCIATRAFPSTSDVATMWRSIWAQGSPLSAKVVGTPLVVISFLGAAGSYIWLDVLYGVVIVFGLPKAFLPA